MGKTKKKMQMMDSTKKGMNLLGRIIDKQNSLKLEEANQFEEVKGDTGLRVNRIIYQHEEIFGSQGGGGIGRMDTQVEIKCGNSSSTKLEKSDKEDIEDNMLFQG